MFSHKFYYLFVFCISATFSLNAQDNTLNNVDTNFNLSNDTLLSNDGLKIYVGQRLIIGKGSEPNGWYSTIGFKNGDLSFPVMFLYETELKNNYEYQQDPQKRVKDKVKEYLHAGDTVIVTKLKKDRNKRKGNWYYTAFLKTDEFPSLKLRCVIINSINKKELLMN